MNLDKKNSLTQKELISLIETILLRTHHLNFLEDLVIKLTHDINNILSVIQLEMDMLNINNMQLKLDNMSTLLKLLQNHCRHKEPSLVCNLNHCIYSTLEIYSPLIKKNIKLDYQLDQSIPLLSFNNIDIEHIIMNLVLSSIQLMDNDFKEEKRIIIRTHQKDNLIHIDIINYSITKTIKEIKCLAETSFNSLLINKKGQMLGISACKKILNKYKGSLKIKNIKNNSLHFLIKLPTSFKKT